MTEKYAAFRCSYCNEFQGWKNSEATDFGVTMSKRFHMQIYTVNKWLGRDNPSSVSYIYLPGQYAGHQWVVEP